MCVCTKLMVTHEICAHFCTELAVIGIVIHHSSGNWVIDLSLLSINYEYFTQNNCIKK